MRNVAKWAAIILANRRGRFVGSLHILITVFRVTDPESHLYSSLAILGHGAFRLQPVEFHGFSAWRHPRSDTLARCGAGLRSSVYDVERFDRGSVRLARHEA